jgi:predicted O-linked N-acetylglucosamine transferase (SPINDLY family)
MPELIVNTSEEYFAKALELATQPQLLQEIRAKQWSNRLTTPLFNTKQYVKDLEELFCEMIKQKS